MRGPMKRRVGGEVVDGKENSWEGVSRVVEKGKRHTEGEIGRGGKNIQRGR